MSLSELIFGKFFKPSISVRKRDDRKGRKTLRSTRTSIFRNFLLIASMVGGNAYAQTQLPRCVLFTFGNCTGTLQLSDGDIYTGEFNDGKPHGKGKFTYGNGDSYSGTVVEGQRNGSGTYNLVNGDKYIGQFREGKFDGVGKYYFLADNLSKGDIYEGEFSSNTFNGQGRYTHADGQEFVGNFSNGRYVGTDVENVPDTQSDITQEAATQQTTAVAKAGSNKLVIAGLAALAAAAAGSSSSSSSTSTSTSTAASGTLYYTEYTAQYGLASINALSLNDSGYTGSGVRLAIVDTGINSSHSEFSGRTISGYDFSTGTGGYLSDVNGHGTHVASIAAGNRDAIGMRGVAYDASLYSYKLLNDSGSVTMTDALYASLFNRHVTDSIKVSNNSWGSSTVITSTSAAYLSSTYPLGIAAMQAAVSAGTIFVWAAGNMSTTTSRVANPSIQAGLPYYVTGLSGQWLAVVATDSSNTEAYYTNRCGVAATWCVTAPGSSIYAAQSSGTYVTYNGTSMAAPHVSGVLATLIQAFPALTPAQVVTRLTSTASLSGLTAYDGCTLATCGTAAMSVIFGYGLINSTAAMARIGSSWVLPSGTNYYSDGTYVANASSAVLPAGLPSSATQAIKNRDFVVFDSFDGANFTIKGSELFGQNTSAKQSNLRYAPSPTGSATSRSSKADFASVNTLPGTDLKFGFAESQQGSIAGNLSFWGDKAFMMPTMDSGNPTQRNYAGEFSLPFGEKSAVNYFYELSQDGKLNAHGFGFTQTVFKKLELNFSAGIANDQSYALGYRSDAVVSNVYSTPMKIGARYPVSDSWEVYGYASSRGVSDLDPTNRSWGLSQGNYSAYSVGAEWKREGGDRFVAGVYQPESLANGSLSLVVPAGRKTDGTILWKKEIFDVNEQVDPGLFLAGKMPLNWGKQNKPELRFQMQTNPQNNHSVDKASLDISWTF